MKKAIIRVTPSLRGKSVSYQKSSSGRAPDRIVQWGGGLLLHFDRLADVAPAGEIPFVGKSGALDWFDWLDSAVAALQENAGTVGLIGEGESVSAGAEPGEFLDEVDF
jgi:hypothetical protein